MLYGDEKVRQISRSVLPATRNRAQSARKDKRAWNRRTRSRMDRDMRRGFHPGMTASAATEAWDDNPSTWLDAYSTEERSDMSWVRDERRLADNLGPIRSWTASKAKDFDDPADLIEELDRLLPDNLAGRHALGHMDTEFGPERYEYRWYRARQRENMEERYLLWYERMVIVAQLSHAELNRRVQRLHNHDFVVCSRRVQRYVHVPNSDSLFRWQFNYRECGGRAHVGYSYDTLECPKCGVGIANPNLRLLADPADINRFLGDLWRAGYHYDAIKDWIATEAERHRQFLIQPIVESASGRSLRVWASGASGRCRTPVVGSPRDWRSYGDHPRLGRADCRVALLARKPGGAARAAAPAFDVGVARLAHSHLRPRRPCCRQGAVLPDHHHVLRPTRLLR